MLMSANGWCPISRNHPAAFLIEGKRYRAPNHYYQTMKAGFFGDKDCEEEIRKTFSVRDLPAVAQQIKNFSMYQWEPEAYKAMKHAVRERFSQSDKCRKFLLGTENRMIVFGSVYEQHWGTGIAFTDADNLDPSKWKGHNYMGTILMELRDEFRSVNVVNCMY